MMLIKLIMAVSVTERATSPFANLVRIFDVTPPGAAAINITPRANSKGVFNISFSSETLQYFKIRIRNSLGAQVYRLNYQNLESDFTKQINLSNFDKGVYFLELETNDGLIYKKIILQ